MFVSLILLYTGLMIMMIAPNSLAPPEKKELRGRRRKRWVIEEREVEQEL